ncbi:MAG: TrmH family RNA methyltransferase [Gemmatimonadota bacterium]
MPRASRARLRLLARLGTRAGREAESLYLLEGRRAIEDALDRGDRLRFLVAAPDAEPMVKSWALAGRLSPKTEAFAARAAELERVADTRTPQGLIAVGELPDLSLTALRSDAGRVLLLVDGVQDPGNLGTLLRTLLAVGGRTAILCHGTVDPYNPKALRGAAGLTPALAVAAHVPAAEAIEWCAERQIPIVLLEAGSTDLFRAPLPAGSLALAVGSEGGGASPALVGHAALKVGLPMRGEVDSLSVAVAGSVALYAVAMGLHTDGAS